MKGLKTTLTAAIAIGLLAGSAVGVAAQDASPEPTARASPVPLEAETVTEPLPVADYWGEWTLHKSASRSRVGVAVSNANLTKSKKVGFFRRLVGVHDDELEWLDNHQPEDCYVGEYERWRAAVEDLRAIHKTAVGFIRKGDESGMKRIAKKRRVASKDLDEVLSNVSDCVDSEPEVLSGDASFVGKWIARGVYVAEGGFIDRSPRRLTISDSGRLLLRIPRNPFCQVAAGLGLVTLTLQGKWEVVVDDVPGIVWTRTRADCYPKGRGRVKVGSGEAGRTFLAYDAAADVLLLGDAHECYWRKKGGSSKDCTAFWRGTHAKADGDAASTEEADTAEGVPALGAEQVDQVAVPAIDGLGTIATSLALRDAGLAAASAVASSDSVPYGTIFDQSPAAGTLVDVGSAVSYSVSLGAEQVDRVEAGLVETFTNDEGKVAYRLTPKGAQLGRSMALAGDEEGELLGALLEEEG